MSYHAIENLVESAVQLIEITRLPITKKRKIVYNLYQFQNKFDTSYTILRCFHFLQSIDFVKKLPIEEHPDFEKHPEYFENLEQSGWIKTDIGLDQDSELVYQDSGFILAEYGSRLWHRLVKSGKWVNASEEKVDLPMVTLIADMIELAQQHDNRLLMQDFYLAFLNAFLEGDLGITDGLPEEFEDWLNDAELLRLREFVVQNDLPKIKKKDTDFEVHVLSSLLYVEVTPLRQAQIRFLMDIKNPTDKIYNTYLKSQKSLDELPLKVEALLEMAKKEMIATGGWYFLSEELENSAKTYKWLWVKNVKSRKYNNKIFTEIILEIELSSVLVKQYVQHGMIMKWQDRQLNNNKDDCHFEINAFELINNEAFKKNLNFLGLWVLPIKSKKDLLLKKSFQQFLNHLTKLDICYLDKIDAEFPDPYLLRPYTSYIDIFESDRGMSDFLLISNLYSISLLFICKSVEEGKIDQALEINNLLEQRLTDRFRNHIQWYGSDYTPYIQAIKKGKKPALPNFYKRVH